MDSVGGENAPQLGPTTWLEHRIRSYAEHTFQGDNVADSHPATTCYPTRHFRRKHVINCALLNSTRGSPASYLDVLIVYTIQLHDGHSLMLSCVNEAYHAILPTRRSFSTSPLPRPRISLRPTPFRPQSKSPLDISLLRVHIHHQTHGVQQSRIEEVQAIDSGLVVRPTRSPRPI
jgi:hypothetical protein